ncbi:MAG: MarR family transcriptional regulator [Desulfobacterales bacterium]|jgi:DNA-binding MarR family transcriptional regulator|nr:MarR family transcriptional regulator [Desulfobacterales bacterium]
MQNMSPSNCPYYLITKASLAMTSMLKKELLKAGLPEVKPAYMGVLMCLWESDGMDEVLGKFGTKTGMNHTELGRCAGLEPSTMTGLIDRMEKDGLVCRLSDPSDRRALKISLTEKGVSVRDKALDALDLMIKESFAAVSPDAMESVNEVLKKILINTNKGNFE